MRRRVKIQGCIIGWIIPANPQPSYGKQLFYPKESVKRQRIEEALVEMITTDLQPSSIVEDSGFKKFVRTLDPQYEMPSRRTIMRKILPAKYEEVRESLHNEINHATHLAITTDIWTSCQRQGPIVVLQPTS